jgi:secreted protein with Ig-like and vWFA domain
LSIVEFDHGINVLTGLTRMGSGGQTKTTTAIERIQSQGGTDIALGLSTGLKVLKQRKARNAITSLLLLTDGQDGSSLARLDSVMKDMPQTSINVFGFGSGQFCFCAIISFLSF